MDRLINNFNTIRKHLGSAQAMFGSYGPQAIGKGKPPKVMRGDTDPAASPYLGDAVNFIRSTRKRGRK